MPWDCHSRFAGNPDVLDSFVVLGLPLALNDWSVDRSVRHWTSAGHSGLHSSMFNSYFASSIKNTSLYYQQTVKLSKDPKN